MVHSTVQPARESCSSGTTRSSHARSEHGSADGDAATPTHTHSRAREIEWVDRAARRSKVRKYLHEVVHERPRAV
eukprot:3757372-Prymnesium_polylepis.1